MTPQQDFKTLRQIAGYTTQDCAKRFKVNKRTVERWNSGKSQPPHAVFLCLQIYSGQLDFLGKQWRGFRITPDCIESPEGDFIYHYEVRALRYVYQQAELKRWRVCRMLKEQQQQQEQRPNKPFLLANGVKPLRDVKKTELKAQKIKQQIF